MKKTLFYASVLSLLALLPAAAQTDPQIGADPLYNTLTGTPLAAAVAVPNPKLMFERSTVLGTDNTVNAYGVPVTNSTGTIQYFDLVVSFTAATNGTPPTTATVTAVPSPKATTRGIIPGNYNTKPLYAGICKVTKFALQSGRTQSQSDCVSDNGYPLQVEVVTGKIDTTHPYYAQLHAAGIDLRGDVGNYDWGVVTNGSYSLGNCGYYSTNRLVGAQQNGNDIVLSLFYQTGATNAFLCGSTLHKV